MRVYSIEPGKLREMQEPDSGTSLKSDGGNVTSVLVPLLRLDKQLTSAALARVGEPVTYRLRYGNGAGASVVNNVVLSDTLPAGLQYVSATPAASVAGSVLTWVLGDLAAGDSGIVDVALQVSATVHDTVRVQNWARLESRNEPPLSAAAAEVALVGPSSAALGLDYTRESSVGEFMLGSRAVSRADLEAERVVVAATHRPIRIEVELRAGEPGGKRVKGSLYRIRHKH